MAREICIKQIKPDLEINTNSYNGKVRERKVLERNREISSWAGYKRELWAAGAGALCLAGVENLGNF